MIKYKKKSKFWFKNSASWFSRKKSGYTWDNLQYTSASWHDKGASSYCWRLNRSKFDQKNKF
jgi:hypothetical protein